ncbi:BTAD domain-containing putative transcriptional regulator [Amycolatopsis tucumanensis]|uniref:BTAD domain-containing putative transcriptional regulator n=1 Tax=Amycolatopsis tucumanensis TaxID=401106 RepID=A0ABP7J923_9PSEU|nr:BTAD domain-containing putative transcriptional regulator [Amycolatopsis tucumanensis]MCF6421751.1 winged helix-turn-helix domain-containing protein [Amycolatopsis tucumanensis]
MRFGVLGPLEVRTAEGEAVVVPGAKVRALLSDLLIHAGEPVPAHRLIEDLWELDPPRDPAAALQVKVSQLRSALERAAPGARELVVSRPAGYLLDVEPDAVDANRFTNLVTAARAAESPADRAALLGEALSLWRGDAFADFAGAHFAVPAITRLHDLRLTALEDRIEARLALGEHDLVAGELGDLIAAHPLRERLHGLRMRALYQAGRQAEALEAYDRLRARLVEELGLEPGAELARLHQAILRRDPALEAARPVRRPVTNLPEPVTDLIGRAEAIDAVSALLAADRVVTLTGPGGVGKTQLALAAARESANRFPDGTWLVELAGFARSGDRDPDAAIADLVTSALGIRDDAALVLPPAAGHTPPLRRLAEALRHKRLLLVLDNCEHLIAPVARVAEALVRASPGLVVLATSREPLGVTGERLWPVPPLDLPGPADADPARVAESSAVRLFVARAAASAPGFALRADNQRAVAAICRTLDGLPLAIELAATRVRALGVHDLALRLEDRFRVLTAGRRTAPARQRTLRAMMDWSWDLLSAAERAVLSRLAVHADGCTLAAAEHVCAGEPAGDVLEVLAGLVDRSLVVADTTGDTRYRLLETVAAYGRERLQESGEAALIRQRHAGYYAGFAEQAADRLRGHDQRTWLERMDAESANLRAALATAVGQDDAATALRLVNAAAWYWFLRGKHQEAHRWITRALAVPGDAPGGARAEATAWQAAMGFLTGRHTDPMRDSAEVLAKAGDAAALARARWLFGFVGRSGAPDAAAALIDRAGAAFRELGDRWGLAATLWARADQAMLRGDLDAAARDGAEAAALFADLGDRWGQVQTASLLGVLAEIGGDHERSARLHREALRKAEELGLWPVASHELSRLGRLALLGSDHAAAEDLSSRALRLATEHAYEPGINLARGGLGMSARRRGLLDVAEEHLRNVLAWERRINYRVGIAFALAELGFAAEQRGDAEAAWSLHREGLDAARATGDPRAVAIALEGLAGAHVLAGEPDRAACLLGVAAAARESAGAPLPAAERFDVDRITAAARRLLGEAAFAEEFDRGRRIPPSDLPLDQRTTS